MFWRCDIFSILSSPLLPLVMEMEGLLTESDHLAQLADKNRLIRLPNYSHSQLFLKRAEAVIVPLRLMLDIV